MHHRWFICILLLAALPVMADEWEETYTVDGKPTLVFESNDASIAVVGWDRNEIHARVTAEGWEIGEEVTIEDRHQGDRVEISVRLPRFSFNWVSKGRRGVRVEVSVPTEAELELNTGDGRVAVEDVAGRIQAHTGDGNIHAVRLVGNIGLSTGDGSITAEDLDGDINLSTGDGSVRGGNFTGRLTARTGDGNVGIEGRFDYLELRTGDGNIDAAAHSGSRIEDEWHVQTGDGHIEMRLPSSFAADLDAKTGDGRVSVDFSVEISGTIKKSQIRGKMNGGGSPLTVRSGDGNISLEQLIG